MVRLTIEKAKPIEPCKTISAVLAAEKRNWRQEDECTDGRWRQSVIHDVEPVGRLMALHKGILCNVACIVTLVTSAKGFFYRLIDILIKSWILGQLGIESEEVR